MLVTGANDDYIKVVSFEVYLSISLCLHIFQVWEVEPPQKKQSELPELASEAQQDSNGTLAAFFVKLAIFFIECPDTLVYALSNFISIPSVSGVAKTQEHCRQAAIWLRKCLSQLGADASLVNRLCFSWTRVSRLITSI